MAFKPNNMPKFLVLSEDLLHTETRDNGQETKFSCAILAAAIMKGEATADNTRSYLSRYDRRKVEADLSSFLNNQSPILVAAKKNLPELMEVLLEHGADPNGEHVEGIPLLAWTILSSHWTLENIDKMVAILLSHGANPRCIPEHMWHDYIKSPTDHASPGMIYAGSQAARWMKDQYRIWLVSTLNLSIRYLLNKANRIKPPSNRQKQIATLCKCPQLLRLPYHLVGQDRGLELVMKTVLSYNAQDKKRPLVIAFAGLSGHGKTELATQMGSLLGTDLCNIDMTKIETAWDLHGAPPGYCGSDDGSQFNNFLTEHDKKPCVIFLDEFDKTRRKVRESLLTIMDTGITKNSRTGLPLDVSRSVWILASNMGDEQISNFYENNMKGAKSEVSIEPLLKELTRLFIGVYTSAVTGRISTFVPFFPFAEDEAAAIIHKFLRSFGNNLRLPIDMHSSKPRLIGNIHLNITEDGLLCSSLARDFYYSDLGARSLRNCVDGLEDRLFTEYINDDEEITEKSNGRPLTTYTMSVRGANGEQEVVIFKDGETPIPSRY